MKRALIVFLLINLILLARVPVTAPMQTSAQSATPMPTVTLAPMNNITPTVMSVTPVPSTQDANRAPIVVAMITSISALVGSIISTLLTFSTQRKLQRLEANKMIVDFLIKKKEALEDARRKLQAIARDGKPLTAIENVLENTVVWFSGYSSVFDEIKHLLQNDVSERLNSQKQEADLLITTSIARKMANSTYDVRSEMEKTAELMAAFVQDLPKAIDKELRATVEEIVSIGK